MMRRWRIENTHTGVVMGTYEGEDQGAALEALARDARVRNLAQ